MHLTELSVVALDKESVTVATPGPAGDLVFRGRHADHPALRAAVGALMTRVAWHTRLTASGHVCSRCGVCCHRPRIAVGAQDVFRLARRRGETDTAFRERYL